MAADAQSETETPFSSGELAVYSRFASYPFEKDHVFTKGQEGVRKRAEEKWDSEHPDAASDDPARADFVDTELVGAKIFYFERAHSAKIDVARLNTFLTLRSKGLLPTPSSTRATPTHVFEAFLRYDFSHDPSFEAGIAAILEKHGEGKEREDAVEKAKAWYYNRFIQPMDYAEFAAWKARRESGEPEEELDDAAPVSTAAAVSSTAAPAADAQDGQTEGEKTEETEQAAAATDASAASEPRYPASFMELCQMLAEGKPIPGIREIPNKINEGTPSEAKVAPRKKPWEK